ncbi:MAG: hypothetical protein ACRC26_04440 [Bacteroidales bacterium]
MKTTTVHQIIETRTYNHEVVFKFICKYGIYWAIGYGSDPKTATAEEVAKIEGNPYNINERLKDYQELWQTGELEVTETGYDLFDSIMKQANIRKNSYAYKALYALTHNDSELEWYNYVDRDNAEAGVRVVIDKSRKYLDYTSEIIKGIDHIGVRYSIGNDAPKGGKTGRYIRLGWCSDRISEEFQYEANGKLANFKQIYIK